MNLNFKATEEEFIEDTNIYKTLWKEKGQEIIIELENVTGLEFHFNDVEVLIYEGVSQSGDGDKPMRLRASYDNDTKLGTLIHELGHLLLVPLKNRKEEIDEHKLLFCFLYDVWSNLYGKEFADRQVRVESERSGKYEYKTAWEWVMSKTQEERALVIEEVKSIN